MFFAIDEGNLEGNESASCQWIMLNYAKIPQLWSEWNTIKQDLAYLLAMDVWTALKSGCLQRASSCRCLGGTNSSSGTAKGAQGSHSYLARYKRRTGLKVSRHKQGHNWIMLMRAARKYAQTQRKYVRFTFPRTKHLHIYDISVYTVYINSPYVILIFLE